MMDNFDSFYGSDRYGLVWGYCFIPGQPAREVSTSEALNLLENPVNQDLKEFFWLHFALSNSSSEAWLQKHLTLPQSFYESLRNEVRSTRLEQEGNAFVGVIYDVLFDFTFDPKAIATASLFIGPKLFVSARLRPLRTINQLKLAVQDGKPFESTVELLSLLLEKQAQVLLEIVRQSNIHVDDIEDKLLANRISISRRELGNLRRVLVRLQRLLAPEPEALFRTLNHSGDWISDGDRQKLSQAAEEFSSTINNTASLVERVKLLQDELSALVNEQTNRSLYVLTIVTVLALPINIVAGLLGMNVGGIPLENNADGFLSVVVILSFLTGTLLYFSLLRHRN